MLNGAGTPDVAVLIMVGQQDRERVRRGCRQSRRWPPRRRTAEVKLPYEPLVFVASANARAGEASNGGVGRAGLGLQTKHLFSRPFLRLICLKPVLVN